MRSIRALTKFRIAVARMTFSRDESLPRLFFWLNVIHLLSFDFIIPYITGYVKRFSELYSVYFAQTYPVIHMGFVYIRLIKTVLYYSLEVIHRGRIQKEKKRSRTGSGQPREKLRSS
nr:MAG TPA: hypothetical protein [Bacteriophage sp.]